MVATAPEAGCSARRHCDRSCAPPRRRDRGHHNGDAVGEVTARRCSRCRAVQAELFGECRQEQAIGKTGEPVADADQGLPDGAKFQSSESRSTGVGASVIISGQDIPKNWSVRQQASAHAQYCGPFASGELVRFQVRKRFVLRQRCYVQRRVQGLWRMNPSLRRYRRGPAGNAAAATPLDLGDGYGVHARCLFDGEQVTTDV